VSVVSVSVIIVNWNGKKIIAECLGKQKVRILIIKDWHHPPDLIACHKPNENRSPILISKGFSVMPVLCASNTPAHFTMSSIAVMAVMIFLKALYSLKSHPSQHAN
jgi:hypothetical protein